VLPLYLIDAFTATPYAGNPCAVVLDAGSLDRAAMQAIASEMNQAETAFVRSCENGTVEARYFTPAEEIPFAGHPTVATFTVLLDAGRINTGRHQLVTPGATIFVEVSTADGVATVEMTQKAPEFGRTYAHDVVAPAFGLRASDLLGAFPPQTVSTGTPMLMVLVQSRNALERATLMVDRYQALHAEGDFFSPHLFWLGGATPEGDTYARQFGLPPDLPEDPFTGSATGAMAAYLWRYGLLPNRTFVAEQGHGMGRPGKAWVHVLGDRDAIQGVRVRGEAVVVVRGTIEA